MKKQFNFTKGEVEQISPEECNDRLNQVFDFTSCKQCDWYNFCIPDECPCYDIHDVHTKESIDESVTHCPNCGKDCTNNLYFLNTGLCETCDTL